MAVLSIKKFMDGFLLDLTYTLACQSQFFTDLL